MFEMTDCWITDSLDFQAPGGPLQLSELRCTWEGEGSTVRFFRLRFLVDAATWARIDADELFALEKARRGATFRGGFVKDKPIEIEAELRQEHLGLLMNEEVEDILDAAAMVLATPALQEASAWRGRLAVQERLPGLKGGFTMQS